MAELLKILPIDPDTFSSDIYSLSDESLLSSFLEENEFNRSTDYVEFAVFNLNNNIIYPGGNDLTFNGYRVLDNEIYVDPENDLVNIGLDNGIFNVVYNFYRRRLSSSPQQTYFIKEISSDRTEIRLDSNIISEENIISSTNEFIKYREEEKEFPDFYINFGSNLLFIANNILLDEDNTILIKLYEPLPSNIDTKISLWVVEKISNSIAYRVEFNNVIELPDNRIFLKGPNLNLDIKDQINNSSEFKNLLSYTSPSSQSEYQVNSYFEDPSINIGIDFTNFGDFVKFSSAEERVKNFWYKASLIESASLALSNYSSLNNTAPVSSSKATLNQIINDTITTFDKYEYYLYFVSSSDTFPKISSTPPYQNVSTGSLAATSWYSTKISEAQEYDEFNYDWLYNAIPEYLRDDSANVPYFTFVNMIGHFVDENIWVYLKDTTNKWNADNRLEFGVSKDLISQILKDIGVKIYQNNYSVGDLYSSFLGFTPSGSLFPYPNMTGSLPTPEGYEYIENFVTSSNEEMALDNINKRVYKRLYHTLPYLLKQKGTVEGLRSLINLYGIPDTLLQINEFGGKDRINVNDWDLWKHQFNYAYSTDTDGYIETDWKLQNSWDSENPGKTLQFRFKTNGVGDAGDYSLWSLDDAEEALLVLDYNGSGNAKGSWSGSITDPQNQYANLIFYPQYGSSADTNVSISLPFFDGNWWSVMLTVSNVTEASATYTLYAGNKIYSGSDGSSLGFYASSSVEAPVTDDNQWGRGTTSYFPTNGRQEIGGYLPFSGSYQEIRYFVPVISESIFKDYIMNPQSIEGNNSGSTDQLAFRGSLGGELYTGSVSIHPKATGSEIIDSFIGNSDITITNGSFVNNREWIFYDSPSVGIKNRNNDKIKQISLNIPSGNVISSLGTVQQKSYTSENYTNNLNLLEVAFSPQNQLNDDIINHLGFFNIGDYIGDPRLISSSANTYPSLNKLRDDYFSKYYKNYDVYDFIRLIKFFDNSLFKMVKDYVPARTSLATGIVIKQHILERQKYPQPQASWEQPEYSGSIKTRPGLADDYTRLYTSSGDFESFPIETITGSAGGSTPELNVGVGDTFGYTTNNIVNVSQSYTEDVTTPVGIFTETRSTAKEFIDGEYSGSNLTVTTQSLNPGCFEVFLKSQGDSAFYTMSFFKSTDDISVSDFLNESVIPLDGYFYLYYDTNTVPEVPIGNSSQPGDARPI